MMDDKDALLRIFKAEVGQFFADTDQWMYDLPDVKKYRLVDLIELVQKMQVLQATIINEVNQEVYKKLG